MGGTEMRVDVLVAGAGSAGAPLAALLSSDPRRRVLLVEAGDNYRSAETPEAIKGPNFAAAIALGKYHWPELAASLTDRQPPGLYLTGRGVGGSSAINGQGAVRGMPADFNRWAAAGCAGWGWEEVLPTFRRLEHDHDFGHRSYHGAVGPIPVRREPAESWGAVSRSLTEVALALGHSWSDDLNAPDSAGVSPIPWNRVGGVRVSTNDAYLEPARDRVNLQVLANTQLERLLLSGSRVCGAELASATGSLRVEAGEVALCAGAIHSPVILMRSGIGPADELRGLGIEPVVDLPGVGRNLQDHPMVWLTFPLARAARSASANILPSGCVLRFALPGEGGHANEISIMPLERSPMDVEQGGVMIGLMRAASRGRVRLVSRDPGVEPSVDFRMLSERRDLDRLRGALRYAAVLARSPALAATMDAELCLDPGRPLAVADDGEVDQWLQRNCIPHFHAAGTCRMAPAEDPAAVVDTDGRVHGVEGLRVVDASIMPDLPTAPTHLTTVMLAEHIVQRASG